MHLNRFLWKICKSLVLKEVFRQEIHRLKEFFYISWMNWTIFKLKGNALEIKKIISGANKVRSERSWTADPSTNTKQLKLKKSSLQSKTQNIPALVPSFPTEIKGPDLKC